MFTLFRRGTLGRIAIATAALAVVLGGCSPAGPSAAPATPTSAPATSPVETSPPATPAGDPVGVIALGHSGINGEGNPTGPVVSWVTGTSTSVNSVYLRLVEVLPETEGHVANVGISGSRADALSGQFSTAFREVPAPLLVLVQTMENDFRCAEDETPYVTQYGEGLTKAFDQITDATPESSILIVSSFGRPARFAALFEDRPVERVLLGGGGPCDMFDRQGTLVPEKVDRLTQIVELYEAEAARVCGLYPQCHTDDGLFTSYEDAFEDLAPDLGHLNARGQAKLAELIWPRVVEILGLE